MKRLAMIIAGLVLLGVALVFLNQGVRRSAMPDKDEDEQAQAASAQKAPALTPTDSGAALLPEEAVGNPATAKHHIEVGWAYDERNQQRPASLAGPIQAIRNYVGRSGGTVSAEIVNLDVPTEDRSPAARTVTKTGIRVDGHSLFEGNLSDVSASEEMVTGQLNGAIGKK